jgi:hypothetical protein
MRKVFMAMGLAGALALGSFSALANSDSGLVRDGKAALQSLKLARATCFDTLEGTFDSLAVPDAKEAQAEAALQTAQDAIDHGNVNAVSAFTGLKAALEAVQDEDEDEDGTTADKAAALQAAIDKAKIATAAIPAACSAANTALHNALVALGGVPAVEDENEDEDDDDAQADSARMTTPQVMVQHEKHEKKDHEKKQEREHEDSERD